MGDKQPEPVKPPKKGFWSKVADAIGEMIGQMIENRQ